MTKDILEKPTEKEAMFKKLILWLSCLFILISLLIYFSNNHMANNNPPVIAPDGATKTIPDSTNGDVSSARVYDILEQKPVAPASVAPTSVGDIVASANQPKKNTPNQNTTKPTNQQSNSQQVASKPATPADYSNNPYVIQLASFNSLDNAQIELRRIKPKISNVIAFTNGRQFRIQKKDINDQTVFRLQIIGFKDKNDANQHCNKIRSQIPQIQCFVLIAS